MKITLSPYDLHFDYEVACARTAAARAQGRRQKRGPDRGWLGDILGVHGEHVVAKALGVYFDPDVGGNDRATGDVCGLHVRTRRLHSYQLWVDDDEPDDGVFVLVTGEPAVFDLRGWISGAEARRVGERLALNGPPATFVAPYLLGDWESRPFLALAAAS